jgi:von Willebrand factor type A domain
VPATKENLQKAQKFLESREGSGGTEMMKAIKASMDPSDAQGHVRIVCFMTDGYVGNDMEIIAEVRKHTNARVFAFGIGSSVNRFLLDNMARYGRGEVEYVALNDDGSAAARRFHERVRNPLLTDISIDWNGLPVADVYPQQIPDLFSAKPVVLTGRFTRSGAGVLRLKGKMSGRDFVREIPVEFPEVQAQHDVLATLWARTRVDDLMGQDYNGLQQGNMRDDLKQTITQLGLEYRLMTQFTSFVAVEEMIVTDGGKPRRIDVPVEVPEGVSREGVFGAELNSSQVQSLPMNARGYGQFAILSGMSNVVTKSGTNSGSKARRSASGGGGIATGSGGGVGPGRSGNAGGGNRKAGGGAGGGAAASPSPPNAAMTVTVVADEVAASRSLSPEEEKRQRLLTKLNPSLLAVIERLKNKEAKPGPDEARFIRDGKAEIQIWLNEKSEENLAELKKLGFEVVLDPKTAKLVIGRLPVEKLDALAELKFVRYVAPQLSGN